MKLIKIKCIEVFWIGQMNLMTLTLLLFFTPQTLLAQDENNGIWWIELPNRIQIGYVRGWIDGAGSVNQENRQEDIHQWRIFKERGLKINKLEGQMTFFDSLIVMQLEDSLTIEQRYIYNEKNYGIIHGKTVFEIWSGLDRFYSNDENLSLSFTTAIKLLKMELEGVSKEYIEMLRKGYLEDHADF